MTTRAFGSDVVVAQLRDLGLEYIAMNPGASFRGLHDSLVDAAPDAPQIVTCLHEEIAVAVAHGYAKAAGRPMAVGLHNVVGLQHACMALYNAWCDRVPIIAIGATGPVAADRRRPWIEWIHTALVQGSHVRDFTKWDDQPASVAAALESLARGYHLAVSAPQAPVYVCLPVEVQEDELHGAPPPTPGVPPVGRAAPSSADVEAAARALQAAARPVILADRAGQLPGAVDAIESLAALLAAPVIDLGGRMNIRNSSPYDLTGDEARVIGDADVILALEVYDLFGALELGRERRDTDSALPAVIHVSQAANLVRSWAAEYQRLAHVDVLIPADAVLAVQALADVLGGSGRDAGRRGARREAIARRHAELRAAWRETAESQRSGRPIAVSTIALEVERALAGRSWLLAHGTLGGWARRLWSWDEPGAYLGGNGGGGIGYGPGAAIGAALAARGSGRIVVNLQPDGDLLFTPSALWTMAHEGLPVLNVVWNNRTYYNSEEHARRIATHRGRDASRAGIGTRIDGPAVDFAGLARSFGLHAEQPVLDPLELPAALERAVAAVEAGQPALVDVVSAAR